MVVKVGGLIFIVVTQEGLAMVNKTAQKKNLAAHFAQLMNKYRSPVSPVHPEQPTGMSSSCHYRHLEWHICVLMNKVFLVQLEPDGGGGEGVENGVEIW